MTTDAMKRAKVKYFAEKCSQIAIRPRKEDADMIRESAKKSGLSLQGYIVQACREKATRDSEKGEET